MLDATFWNSPHTIRYALQEHGYGFEAIHKHRVMRPPGPGIEEHRIRLEILTLGRDLATVNLEFKVRGHDLIGRQSQTWGAVSRSWVEGYRGSRVDSEREAILVNPIG